jgi:hypothetical protein
MKKQPHARPRIRGRDNVPTDLKEIVCEDAHWINQAEDRVQWQVYHTGNG